MRNEDKEFKIKFIGGGYDGEVLTTTFKEGGKFLDRTWTFTLPKHEDPSQSQYRFAYWEGEYALFIDIKHHGWKKEEA